MRRKTSLTNALLVVAFCLVICGPMAMAAASNAGVELPARLAGGDAAYLEGSRESPDLRLSPSAFVHGELQDGVDVVMRQSVPFRADVLLSWAAAQRASIRIANVPFGYPAYPTFYGSRQYYLPDVDAITIAPARQTSHSFSPIDWFCEQLADFASRHPDNGFYLVIPCGAGYAPASPLYGLMANPLTAREVMGRVRADLEGLDNVTVISDEDLYDSPADYYRAYYRTDHHWNIRGIQVIYQRLALAQGKDPEPFGEITDVPGLVCNGSGARQGLMLVGESVPVAADAFGGVSFTFADGTTQLANVHPETSPDDPRSVYDFYSKYHRNPVLVSSDAEGRALLARDSFGTAFIAPVGTLYGELVHSNCMHPSGAKEPLETLMAESGADDVVFVCGVNHLVMMRGSNPGFFE